MTTRHAQATALASLHNTPTPSARRRTGRTRLACVAIGALLAVLGAAIMSSGVAAQQADEVVRIVARKLENGKVEFALQQHRSDGSWGDRRLPSKRLLPTTATVGRWLQSTPLSVTITAPPRGETPAPVEDEAVNQPEEDQVMHPNSDFVAQDRMLLARVMNCLFDIQTGECRFTIDGWDAERIILEYEQLYGHDCDPDPRTGHCFGWDSWTLEMYDQRISELVCLRGWYYSRHDWLCHSTLQTS